VAIVAEKLKTRPLHPTQKVEFKFRLLLWDTHSTRPPIDMLEYTAIIDYGRVFQDKLVAAKIMHSQCRQSTEELVKVYEREKKQHLLGASAVGPPMTYASVYFEAFLYFITGAFDVLASINHHLMYRDHRKSLTDNYFKNQMETFLKHPNINSDYAKLLSKNRHWIDDIQENRDGLAHKGSVFLGFEKSRVVVEKRHARDDKELSRKRQFRDLLQYLDTTLENLYKFLDDYVAVHRKRVPFSDHAKMELDMLDKDLIFSGTLE